MDAPQLLEAHTRLGQQLLDFIPPSAHTLHELQTETRRLHAHVALLEEQIRQLKADAVLECAKSALLDAEVAKSTRLGVRIAELEDALAGSAVPLLTQQLDITREALNQERAQAGTFADTLRRVMEAEMCEKQRAETLLQQIGGQCASMERMRVELETLRDHENAVHNNASKMGLAFEDRMHKFLLERFGRVAEVSRTSSDGHAGDFMLTFEGDTAEDEPMRVMVEAKTKASADTYLRGDRDVGKFHRDMQLTRADYGIMFGHFRIAGGMDSMVAPTHAFVAHHDFDVLGATVVRAQIHVLTRRRVARALKHVTLEGQLELHELLNTMVKLLDSSTGKHYEVAAVCNAAKREAKDALQTLQALMASIQKVNVDMLPRGLHCGVETAMTQKKRARIE